VNHSVRSVREKGYERNFRKGDDRGLVDKRSKPGGKEQRRGMHKCVGTRIQNRRNWLKRGFGVVVGGGWSQRGWGLTCVLKSCQRGGGAVEDSCSGVQDQQRGVAEVTKIC